jgi:EAL domain-containing protein (putative c-di-GMP-specific phosphodiesterase class I)
MAVHLAKEHGGNTFQFYQSNIVDLEKNKAKLEYDLYHGLKNNQFELYYQPIVEIKTNKVLKVEALLRWHHPDGLIIPTEIIIRHMEMSNLITQLGEWILQTACQQTKELHSHGWSGIGVAINISVLQLTRSFVTLLSRTLMDTKLHPSFVSIELTEDSLMQDTESNIYLLGALKALGVNIVIDDFGTGYSSLAYVNKFAVNSLKIDRSFIASTPANANSSAIVSAVIAMAHSLNLSVTAEGVETEEQLRFLQEKNCDKYQGFYFSEALPMHELIKFLSVKTHKS